MGIINTCVEQIYYVCENISKTFIDNVYILGWRENINLIQSEYAQGAQVSDTSEATALAEWFSSLHCLKRDPFH